MAESFSQRLAELFDSHPEAKAVDLARACGVKPPSVSEWRSGATKHIEARHLLMVARFFRVNPEWLLFGTGRRQSADRWPFELFSPDDYQLVPLAYRQRIENELASEILRVKRLGNGKAA